MNKTTQRPRTMLMDWILGKGNETKPQLIKKK